MQLSNEDGMSKLPATSALVVNNTIERYYDHVQRLLYSLPLRRGESRQFDPGVDLPSLSAEMVNFFAPSSMAVHYLHGYRTGRVGGNSGLRGYEGHKIALLDLMRNPATRTTKSLASLLMVARAVEHIRRSGRRVMLLTPSSANKATALRDAVLRAITHGLAGRDRLQIISIVPESSAPKLWSSRLSTDPDLRERNPMILYRGAEPSGVKALAQHVHDECVDELRDHHRTDLWYTLDIENYKVADAMRAMVEYEIHPPDARGRLHVHAVSSAYGLLGHNLGYLSRTCAPAGRPPRYFLVQHLGTPDMVLSLRYGSPARELLPEYDHDPVSGLYRQYRDPHFPGATLDPNESLDPTFYTRRPPTSAEMNQLIKTRGGGGIVVSLHECLSRYGQVRALLAPAVDMPADPRQLREWSLVMAATGLLNALDRGLVTDDDILIHGSGCYGVADYQVIPASQLTEATGPQQVRRALFDAIEARRLERI